MNFRYVDLYKENSWKLNVTEYVSSMFLIEFSNFKKSLLRWNSKNKPRSPSYNFPIPKISTQLHYFLCMFFIFLNDQNF